MNRARWSLLSLSDWQTCFRLVQHRHIAIGDKGTRTVADRPANAGKVGLSMQWVDRHRRCHDERQTEQGKLPVQPDAAQELRSCPFAILTARV